MRFKKEIVMLAREEVGRTNAQVARVHTRIDEQAARNDARFNGEMTHSTALAYRVKQLEDRGDIQAKQIKAFDGLIRRLVDAIGIQSQLIAEMAAVYMETTLRVAELEKASMRKTAGRRKAPKKTGKK